MLGKAGSYIVEEVAVMENEATTLGIRESGSSPLSSPSKDPFLLQGSWLGEATAAWADSRADWECSGGTGGSQT